MSKVAIIMPIVVPSVFHRDMTIASIQNLGRFTEPSIYQLVVIHGVCEPYEKEIKKIIREEDVYVGHKENISQPKALNDGIEMTESDYVCIFSNDCFVHRGWLEPLIEGIKKDKGDISGPWWENVPYNLKTKEEYSHVSNYRNLGMNAALFTRDLYKKIGPFDERMTRLFWDMDYANRINLLGLRMIHCKDSEITSLGSATINLLEERVRNGTSGEIEKYSSDELIQSEAIEFNKKWGQAIEDGKI